MVKMRLQGIELDRRVRRPSATPACWSSWTFQIIMDVSDQGLRRSAKVVRLMQGQTIRHELTDVHIVWANDGRFTLSGFERHRNASGQSVDFAQSWLCTLDFDPVPELVLSKQRNVRPQG